MGTFTTDKSKYDQIAKWRDDAVADGWLIEPQYQGEDQERVAKMSKEGFKAMVVCRSDYPSVGKYDLGINIWAPDGLQLMFDIVYSWDNILAGLRTCAFCKKTDVDTSQVGFAGRSCADCMKEQTKRLEYPGWTR